MAWDMGMFSPQYGTATAADDPSYLDALSQMRDIAASPETRAYDSLFADPPSWWTRHGQPIVNALGAIAPYIQPTEWPHPQHSPMLGPNYRPLYRYPQQWHSPQPTPGYPHMGPALAQRVQSPYFAGGGPIANDPLVQRYASMGATGGRQPAEQFPASVSLNLFRGPGGGQQDKLPAKVSPGEYIISAPDVSMLGEGANEEGARRLDHMREAARRHLGKSIAAGGHPPKPKTPLQYMFGKK